MDEYEVVLDVIIAEKLMVEADSEEQAIEQAKLNSNFRSNGREPEVSQVNRL